MKHFQTLSVAIVRQKRLDERLVADEDYVKLWLGRNGMDGAGHNWTRRMIPPHRIESDAHGYFSEDSTFTT
jgi:hypothetical protein